MAGTVIALTDAAAQSLYFQAADAIVRLLVWWQPYDSAWYVTVESPPGTVLSRGRRIVSYGDLLGDRGIPFPGSLQCLPRDPLDDSEPGRRAWTTTHSIIYGV